MKFIIAIFLVVIVSATLFSFADIGGNIALSIAKTQLSKNYKIGLLSDSITGNPVKGYTIHNFGITDQAHSRDIFSAGYLSARINLTALLTGNLRIAEVSLGGISLDVEDFIAGVKGLSLSFDTRPKEASTMLVSPAFADEKESLPELPIDRITIKDSRFSSRFGVIGVNDIAADVANLDVSIDGTLNGIPLIGKIDMESLTAVNRSELKLGSAKITATGGLISDRLDIHMMAEGLDLKEATALYPAMLKADDFDGTANFTADITGTTESPKLTGSFSYKGAKIYGYPVERASANIAYSSHRISVSNIQASAFNVPVQGELAAAMRPGEKLSVMVRLDGSEANLDGLDKVFGIAELRALSGKVSLFNVNISGPVDSLSGLVNFSAPRIVYDGRALTNIRAQMKLAKSDTATVDGKFTFQEAPGYVSGTVASLLTQPAMNLTAKIVDLDIKQIESMIPDAPQYKLDGKITASVNIKGTASNPNVTGEINSPEFHGWDQVITKPAINFTFSDNALTLVKTQGTLNGMPINVTGKISPLPSMNPNLDINATMTMTTTALKSYVPDIDSYNLKGTINAGLKIQGNADNPSVRLLATSPNLQAMDVITAKNLELTTALNGDLAKLERISVNMAAKSLTASGATFTDINANISKNGDKIILGGLNAKSGTGTITGAGTASISGSSPMDFSFTFTGLVIESLASSSGLDMKGKLSGTLKIAGSNSNPLFNLSAHVPSMNVTGLTMSNVAADISGNMNSAKLNNMSANVKGSNINAKGEINISPAIKINVSISGNNVDLAKLLEDYPAMKGKISGKAALTMNITGNDTAIKAAGKITAPSLLAYNMKLSEVNLPLSYSGNNLTSKGGTAKLYGGTLKNTLSLRTDNMSFTDNIDASAFDVNAMLQDISGGLGGKITGTGKFALHVTGSAGDKVSYSGNGNFSMGQGAITGFKWLDIFTRLHKSDGLRYANVNAPIVLQTGKIILKSGSIANANKNDALYKYAKLTQDGTIDFSGRKTTLDLLTESNVNYQLINAIQGGVKGGIDALLTGEVSGFEDNVRAFLTGGISEAKQAGSTWDFRTLTLGVHGDIDSLSFSGLKIGPSTVKTQAKPSVKPQPSEKPKSSPIDEVKKVLKIDESTPQKILRIWGSGKKD